MFKYTTNEELIQLYKDAIEFNETGNIKSNSSLFKYLPKRYDLVQLTGLYIDIMRECADRYIKSIEK